MSPKELTKMIEVRPGKRLRLAKLETNAACIKSLRHLTPDQLKQQSKDFISKNLGDLDKAQELLYAADHWAVLIIFQAMDAAGKDGTIKHVMSGLNPQGCQVASFKKPSDEELDHTFLWRYWQHLPQRGRLGIFNRSYYEETLVVRVHPELLERQKLPPGKRGKKFWKHRWDDINNFERHLARNGTLILKFFLNVSKGEQKKRLLDRLEEPDKHWKFSPDDLKERQYWGDYMKAFEDTISATSTPWAPWYVIPADNKWAARAAVSTVITHAIESLHVQAPKLSKEQLKALRVAKTELMKA